VAAGGAGGRAVRAVCGVHLGVDGAAGGMEARVLPGGLAAVAADLLPAGRGRVRALARVGAARGVAAGGVCGDGHAVHAGGGGDGGAVGDACDGAGRRVVVGGDQRVADGQAGVLRGGVGNSRGEVDSGGVCDPRVPGRAHPGGQDVRADPVLRVGDHGGQGGPDGADSGVAGQHCDAHLWQVPHERGQEARGDFGSGGGGGQRGVRGADRRRAVFAGGGVVLLSEQDDAAQPDVRAGGGAGAEGVRPVRHGQAGAVPDDVRHGLPLVRDAGVCGDRRVRRAVRRAVLPPQHGHQPAAAPHVAGALSRGRGGGGHGADAGRQLRQPADSARPGRACRLAVPGVPGRRARGAGGRGARRRAAAVRGRRLGRRVRGAAAAAGAGAGQPRVLCRGDVRHQGAVRA
ncbi:hypothetical protein LPJ70_007018, partial [Coemansia sp. RSA 2708]